MTKPNPANPAFPISHPDLASALAQIGTEIVHQPLRSSALARIMRETFHGNDAGGAWDWRMAYDLMQAAAVQVLLRGEGASGDIAAARLLASRLLTETRGSGKNLGVMQRPCGMRRSTFHQERQPARRRLCVRLWVTISCVDVFPCVCCRCHPRSLLHGTKRLEDHCGTANHSRSGYPYCLPDRCRVPGNALGRGWWHRALRDHLC